MVKAATPAFRVFVPSWFEVSENVTVPVGVPLLELTAAVKVTFCPYKEGFKLELKLTVAAPVVTCCTIGAEVTSA
jgi:hypothetical protein